MYKPLIEIFYGEMQTQLDRDILKAVQKYYIVVDKDELIRALAYDREQYEKGYGDGTQAVMESIVHCEDCKWRGIEGKCPMYHVDEIEWDDDGYTEVDYVPHDYTIDEGFCDRGERRTNNG